MKIPRYLRGTTTWAYTVTGPGVEDKQFPSEGAALGFAQMYARRVGGTFYVREHGDVIAWAEQRDSTTVTVRP